MSFQGAPYAEEMGTGLRIQATFVSTKIQRGGDATGNTNNTMVFAHEINNATSSAYSVHSAGCVTANFDVMCQTSGTPTALRECSIFGEKLTAGVGTAANRLGLLAQYFRYGAIRLWKVKYIPDTGTEISGNVALASDRCEDTYITSSIDQSYINNLNNVLVTPVWKSAELTVVSDLNNRPAARIYKLDGSAVTNRCPVSLLGYCTAASSPSTTTVYGSLEYTVVMDVYSMKNQTNGFMLMDIAPVDYSSYVTKNAEIKEDKVMTRSDIKEDTKEVKYVKKQMDLSKCVDNEYVLCDNLNVLSPPRTTTATTTSSQLYTKRS